MQQTLYLRDVLVFLDYNFFVIAYACHAYIAYIQHIRFEIGNHWKIPRQLKLVVTDNNPLQYTQVILSTLNTGVVNSVRARHSVNLFY